MSSYNLSVLLTDGFTRQVLPMSKAFKRLGCEVTTINFSYLDVGYTSKYPDHKIIDKSKKDDYQGRLEMIRNLLKTGKYHVVVPTTDFSAALLSKNKEELSRYAYIAVSDWDTFKIAMDKYETMKICMKNSIPCPKTLLDVSSIEDILNSEISFPIVVKPRIGYGAIGFHIVESEQQLVNLLNKMDIDLSSMIIQEFIPQSDMQYVVAIYVDDNNKVKTALVFSKNRWFPINGGASTLSITVDDDDIINNCKRLVELINWRGCADIDLIRDPRDGIAKIMEINPRTSGNVKICFEAGVDLARQILESACKEEVTEYKDYKKDIRLRCIHTDLLWFIKSKNRFRTKPSWFSLYKTKDQIFSIEDPLPWFSFTLQAICRYKTEMKKRKG